MFDTPKLPLNEYVPVCPLTIIDDSKN